MKSATVFRASAGQLAPAADPARLAVAGRLATIACCPPGRRGAGPVGRHTLGNSMIKGPQRRISVLAGSDKWTKDQFAKPGILPRFASKWARQSRTTFVATSTCVFVTAARPCAGAVLQTAPKRHQFWPTDPQGIPTPNQDHNATFKILQNRHEDRARCGRSQSPQPQANPWDGTETVFQFDIELK